MDYGNVAEWSASIVTGVSALLIWLQLRMDHERSRRALANRLLLEWTDRQKPNVSVAIRIVKNFSSAQCLDMLNLKEIAIPDTEDNRHIITSCLDSQFGDFSISAIVRNGNIYIGGSHVAYIRFLTVGYLNLLESILSSWNSGIASPKIIQKEFEFLRAHDWASLPDCRLANKTWNGGVDPYPSITNFVSAVSAKPEKPLKLLG